MHPNRWGQWKPPISPGPSPGGFCPPQWMGWNGGPPPPPPPPPPPSAEGGYEYTSFSSKEPGVPGEEDGSPAETAETLNWKQQPAAWNMKFPPMYLPHPPPSAAQGGGGMFPQMPNIMNPGGKKKNKKKKKAALAPPPPPLPVAPLPPVESIPPPPKEEPKALPLENSIKAAPQGTPASAMNNSDWPQSLKNYVSRCFSKCVTDIDKDQVEIILKGKITKAANDNTLWTKDWDNEPLPSNLSSDLSVPKVPKINTTGKPGPSGGYGAKFGHRLGLRRARSPSPRSPGSKRNRKNNKRESDDENSSISMMLGGGYTPVDKASAANPNRIPLGKGKQLGKKKNGGPADAVPYFYTNGQKPNMTLDSDLATKERRQKRAARFAAESGGKRGPKKAANNSLLATLNNQLLESLDEGSGAHWESLHIVGTSTELEKRYLRLTTAPEAHMVRPTHVLEKSLQMVMKHWLTKQDYHYACGQFKSIRQDLTVQGVRNDLTVKVYETHARVALEKGDYTEFNQCQSQLKSLYADIGGENRLEFTAYRILYYMYTKEALDIQTVLAELTSEEKKNPILVHILKLRSAWSEQNYHRFFLLYSTSPKMSGYLIDWFINRERKAALRVIIKAYRVNVPLSFIQKELGFLDPSTVSEDWNKFSEPFSLKYSDEDKTMLDCKSSMVCLKDMQ